MAVVTTVKTNTFTVDDVSETPYTVLTKCRLLRIGPQDGAASYMYRAPTNADSDVKKFSGEVTVISRPSPGQYLIGSPNDPGYYSPGDQPAFFKNQSGLGSKTFQVEEFL